ncbi:MAG: hypothetical protein ACPLZH_01980 [Minisyncoccales bacterium]
MKRLKISSFLVFFILELFLAYFHLASQEKIPANFPSFSQGIFLFQGGFLAFQEKPTKKIVPAILTAYSSEYQQTDNTPFLTAANTRVHDGLVANNIFPFGTKIKFPEVFGEKVFVVEDRLHYRKGDYQFDIWFQDPQASVEFGVKITYGEILE